MTHRVRRTSVLIGLFLTAGAVCYALMGGRMLYEWDSVNYALGAGEFDLQDDQPHAPGYFLWIQLMRLVMLLGPGPNLAQIILAGLFSVSGTCFLYALARSWLGSRVALFSAVILFTSPLVGLYCAVALNYSVDLFTACVLAYLAHRLARGDYRLAPLGLGLLTLLAGIRQSGSMYLAPLVVFYVLVSCWRRPLWMLLAILLALVLGCAWFLPTLDSAGGWDEYRALCASQTSDSFTLTSVFFGAGWTQQARNVLKVLFFLVMALSVPLTVYLILRIVLPGKDHAGGRWAPDGPPHPWMFLGLWLLPGLLFLFLFHTPKPGYVLVVLPGIALILAVLMVRALDNQSRARTRAAVLTGVVCLNLGLLLFPYDSVPWGRFAPAGQALGRCGLASVRQSDRALTGVLETIRTSGVAPDCSYVVAFGGRFGTDFRGPNWRKLAYYLPRYRVGYVDTDLLEAWQGEVRSVPGFALPACTTRVWWVVETAAVKAAVLDLVPATDEKFQHGNVVLLSSVVAPDFPGVEFSLLGCRISIFRP